ncbi:MAG: MFS transporter [Pseudomonadota bacterium]
MPARMHNGFNSLRPHARFLVFGFLLSFWSGFGQTYFIALFGGAIREQFSLSSGEFGSIYSLGTLGGAAALVYLGRLIDRVDLRLYAVLVSFALAVGCTILWQANSIPMLIVAMFALRLAGQGLMTHTALTAMGRYFDEARGRAVSVATVGHPVGEALWPRIAVISIAYFGWQTSWAIYALATAVLLPPLVLWLLRGHGDRHDAYLARAELVKETRSLQSQRASGRPGLVLESRTWRLLPSLVALPFIITGLFIHQNEVIAQKDWSLALIANAFIAYSLAAMIAMLIAGPLIDRVSAVRACRLGLVPMMLGVGALVGLTGPIGAFAYLFLAGLSAGMMSTIFGTIWAELYGTSRLGAVRALSHAAMVFFSALGPICMGFALDAGISVDSIALACVVYMLMATVLASTVTTETKPIAA